MTTAELVLALAWVGLTLYVVFGGADFGAGFWDLAAGGSKKGARARSLIEHSIGPVWEANHVWLIFVIVILWTGFPTGFAPMMSTLYIPFTVAAIGIILRGSAFAFRKTAAILWHKRAFGAMFAASSVITPYWLGMVAGAVASGRVPASGTGDPLTSVLHPTGVLAGVMAVTVCAYQAAVFLAADADRHQLTELSEAFRLRAMASGLAAGLVALAGIFILRADAPTLYTGLTGRAAPVMAISAMAGVAALWLLARRAYRAARLASVTAVTAVVWGWAVGQYPFFLVDKLTIVAAAGVNATLVATLVALGIGAALFLPPLAYLLVLTQRGELKAPGTEITDVFTPPPSRGSG